MGESAFRKKVAKRCFNSFSCSIRSEDVRLMLWDTAGQEEFDAITKAYYRGKFLFCTLSPYVLAYVLFISG